MKILKLNAISLSLVLGLASACAFNNLKAATIFPIATNSAVEWSLSSASDGTNFLVAIQGDLVGTSPNRFNLEVQRVSQVGALLGSKLSLGLTDSEPLVAFDGTNYLVVSERFAAGMDGIYGQFVDSLGNLVGTSFTISHGAGVRNPDAVIFGKTNYLVIWNDQRRAGSGPGDHDIYAQRVSATGQLLGGEFKISGAAGKESAVAFDDTNFLVIWNEDVNDTDIHGRLVSPSGSFITSEFVIDGNAFPSDNPSAVIFDGTRYLVVIEDEIGGQGSGNWDLFARFVTTGGSVLTNRVTIAAAAGAQQFPSLAFDGANYLISWGDGLGTTNSNIKFKFFDATGQSYSSEFTVFSAQGTNLPVVGEVLFNGKQYVAIGNVVAFDTNFQFTASDVYGAFVSPLPRGAFPIGITSTNDMGLSMAFDGTNYLMGIQGSLTVHDEITAQMFSSTGALIGTRISTGRFGGFPRVAFDGTNYLMVWEDAATNPNSDIYGQFISRSGTLVGTPLAICSATGKQDLDSINHLVFDGSNYLVVWRDDRNGSTNSDVFGRLLSPAGTFVGPEIPISTAAEAQLEPSASFDGTNYLVAWENKRAGTSELYDTYGKFISKAGVAGSSFLISQNPSPRHNPIGIAFDGVNYMVVWNRDIGPGYPNPGDWDIYARLVTRTGSFVGNEFPITTATGSQFLFGPASYDGTGYLVSWIDAPTGSLKHRSFNRSGTPLASEFSFFGSQGTKFPFGGVIFDGSRLLAAACYVNSNFGDGDVYGLFLPSPRLSFSGPVANGQVPLRFSGMPGVSYAIQATTNLLTTNTTWMTLTSSNTLNGTFNFTDTNAANFSRRFYRAVQQ